EPIMGQGGGLGGGMFNVAEDDPFNFDDTEDNSTVAVDEASATNISSAGFIHDVFMSNGHYFFALAFGWLSGRLSRRLRQSGTEPT
ncbi:hypothetical protein ACFL2H_00645, partial [Planctomycetota bacterium]